ncbi:MAG: 2-amino-4-hydroxy-6-hydroxymethyldihydropteridine diphosphokinase [Halocynthiibacter sp.]
MSQPLSGHNSKSRVLIALGANDSADTQLLQRRLAHSLRAIEQKDLTVVLVSDYYKSPCFPAGAGPDFVNAAACLSTNLGPEEILEHLHQVEADFGRERSKRWGARALDLDLLTYGDAVRPNMASFERWRDLPLERQVREAPNSLILPHPRLQDRAFVLLPLADIAPDWVHPVSGLTVRQMCDALPDSELRTVVAL